jgi:DNA mismatch repair protein MutS2
MLSDESRSFDMLVRQLEERYEALDKERGAAVDARRDADKLRGQASLELEKVRRRDEKKLSDEAEKVRAELRAARAELKEARKALRNKDRHDEAALEAVREQIGRSAQKLEGNGGAELSVPSLVEPLEKGTAVEASSLSVGQRVWVPRLRAEVNIVEPPSKGRVRVASGPVKLWVKVDEVRVVAETASPAPAPAAKKRAPQSAATKPPSGDNTLDLRGMRVDDAISMTESFLDRMFGRSERVAYLLHGVGSGALRDALREHLGQHVEQYVERTRPGSIEEGGERITVVYLR